LGRVDPAVRQVWDTLRTEHNTGQYLDVVGTARGGVSAAEARLIVRHKTAGYTIVRPLQLGAALAGRADLADDIAAHAMPLGTAYQLRDDVLGAFGDPLVTGKPVGEDLREAKPTVLMARARAAATAAQREVLARVGDHATETDITDIQQVIVDTGALEATEAEITDLMSQAVTAIDLLPPVPEARRALVALAEFAVAREA
ncbi:MAG: polyprenyl synthetase family protein, partial [Acidimicrobiales bacterium]